MPIGYNCEYEDFDACIRDQVAQGHTAEEARAICGKIQADTEDECEGRDDSDEGTP